MKIPFGIALALCLLNAAPAMAECHAGVIKQKLHDKKERPFSIQAEGCFTREEARDWCLQQTLPLGYRCFVVRVD